MPKKQRPGRVTQGASLAAEVWLKLDHAVKRVGGTNEDLERLNTDGGVTIIETMAIAIAAGGKQVATEPPPATVVAVPSIVRIVDENTRGITVRVNHDERILAFPGVGWATEDNRESRIADRTGMVEEEIILRCFGRDMSYEDVIVALAKETAFGEDGLEPVSPEELRDLLKITQADPNLPTPIAGLGVSWRHPGGHRHVPYLRGGAGRRVLRLADWFEYDWTGHWWFAVRRKSKP